MQLFIALIASYLLGSIPFAFIVAKLTRGIDLRTVGSGNVGATNAIRAIGFKYGVVALMLDVTKGIVPVVFFAESVHIGGLSHLTTRLILGLVSVCGHNWTILLGFKGGKGIATSLGVFIGLAIKSATILKVMLLLIASWAALFLLIGYVSLASVASAVLLPIFLAVFKVDNSFFACGLFMSILAIYRHKSNISRILQKREDRFNLWSRFSPK